MSYILHYELFPFTEGTILLHFTGSLVAAVHYNQVQELFTRTPIPVLVGPPNTGKSFIGKVMSSLLGLQKAKFDKLTKSGAATLLAESLWFYYDDPENTKTMKELVTGVCYAFIYK